MQKKVNNLLRFLFSKDTYVIAIIIGLTFLVYFNTLNNDFSIVDDYAAIVNKEKIRNVGNNMHWGSLIPFIFSVCYKIAELNPFPYHFASLSLHAVNGVLGYFLIKKLFDKKTALLSTLLFVAHPINTEAVNWISAIKYLILPMFTYVTAFPYINYRKTNDKKYLFLAFGSLALCFILLKTVWLLIIPLTIFVLDLFFINNKTSLKNKLNFDYFSYQIVLIIPVLLAFIPFFFVKFAQRNDLQAQAPEFAVVGESFNQEALTPFFESAPYTIYTMATQYAFPFRLTFYYDGDPVTPFKMILFFVFTAVYLSTIVYFIKKKDYTAGGLMLLLVLLMIPSMFPKKITWFMAERYLYFGTLFFSVLAVKGLVFVQNKYKIKNLALYLVLIITLLFSIRTHIRNNQWQTPETFARSIIQAAPLTYRAYNDLGFYYASNQRYDEAMKYFHESLKLNKYSAIAMNNMGYIFLNGGIDYMSKNRELYTTQLYPQEEIERASTMSFQIGDYTKAIYLYNELWKLIGYDVKNVNSVSETYYRNLKLDSARALLEEALVKEPENELTLINLSYVAFLEDNYEEAKQHLQKVLEINPDNSYVPIYMQQVDEKLGIQDTITD